MKRSRSNPVANGVNGVHHRTAAFSLPELEQLAALIAEPAPSKTTVIRWMQRHLSKNGVLLADPWRTPEAALLLSSFPGGWDALADAAPRRVAGVAKIAARQAVGNGFLEGAAPDDAARLRLLKSFDTSAGVEFRPLGRRLLGAPADDPVPAAKVPGYVDEESRSAVLRRGWLPDAASLAIDYRQFDCRLALHLAGERIVSGPFVTTVAKNGKVLEPVGNWETICPSADNDGEYLELSIRLADSIFLDRHLFIARAAPIVWIVDVIRGDEPAQWRWQSRWRGAAATGLRGEATHRGQRLLGVKTPTALLPVSAPPDPFALGGLRMSLKTGAFEFVQEDKARRAVIALAFVWSEQGPLAINPWRKLTITQDGRLTPTEEAFAFRVPSAGRQCVFYRSLEHERRHAFLGCQTFDETIIGEFDKDGDVFPWMRIE